MTSWLPQDPGFLPWFLLFNAVLSWYNTFNCFFDQKNVRQLYTGPNGSQVNGLSARTFGAWTILSGFVRFYAAYNITDPLVYGLAFWSYFAISIHWTTETFVFRTVNLGVLIYISLAMDCGALFWMGVMWNTYFVGG